MHSISTWQSAQRLCESGVLRLGPHTNSAGARRKRDHRMATHADGRDGQRTLVGELSLRRPAEPTRRPRTRTRSVRAAGTRVRTMANVAVRRTVIGRDQLVLRRHAGLVQAGGLHVGGGELRVVLRLLRLGLACRPGGASLRAHLLDHHHPHWAGVNEARPCDGREVDNTNLVSAPSLLRLADLSRRPAHKLGWYL